MDVSTNTILLQDCISGMNALPAGSAQLVFADPPFNIGYKYDVYDDKHEADTYLSWCHDWIAAAHRVLADDGTFWLAIGDEYAAELKIESQKIGFHCRSWVIWYYTFGVNCKTKFSRSHAHLFYFVKDPKRFTFRAQDLRNRVPSARQLVYNDNRAESTGRLPDDTWIIPPAETLGRLTDSEHTWTLRPQDLADGLQATDDTWYFPRVAGTFKERAGFHGCQMPEQLLGRIIRTCSHDGDLVVDPFSGSATTLVVAKKLRRNYLGFDISPEYVRHGMARLSEVRVGDLLEGSAEPLVSAPQTNFGRNNDSATSKREKRSEIQSKQSSRRSRTQTTFAVNLSQIEQVKLGVVDAFKTMRDGLSADRIVADPDLNLRFADACQNLGLAGEAWIWNHLLLRERKNGSLATIATTKKTEMSWEDCDPFLFASEIALRRMQDLELATSLDEILCNPSFAAKFDEIAQGFAPGFSSLQYRWAALKLRKQQKIARERGQVLHLPTRYGKAVPAGEVDTKKLQQSSGVYIVSGDKNIRLYVGETLNLGDA